MIRPYTRTGDKGETGLYRGPRVAKDEPRVEAYGAIDEVSSAIGVAKAVLEDKAVRQVLERVQNDLFVVGADLATPDPEARVTRVSGKMVTALEEDTDRFNQELRPIAAFVHPGGTLGAALLHSARAVARRSERRVVSLSKREKVNPQLLRYVNRLSSLLYVLARFVNQKSGVEEKIWKPKADS